MSIALQVLEDCRAEGRLAIPDGKKAVAHSFRMSSNDSDKRRLIELIFEDGSTLTVDTRDARLGLSHAPVGEAVYSLANMYLTPDHIEQLTDLLSESKRYLCDAASPCPMYGLNYSSLASRIEEMMESLGMQPD